MGQLLIDRPQIKGLRIERSAGLLQHRLMLRTLAVPKGLEELLLLPNPACALRWARLLACEAPRVGVARRLHGVLGRVIKLLEG